MYRKIVSLITVVLLTSSCSIYHIDSTPTADNLYPSKETQEVVYLEEVDQPYEEIGTVTVNAERRQSVSNVIDKMKREAAILGGDAITNIKSDASGLWKQLPAQEMIGNGYVRANFTATVIAFE